MDFNNVLQYASVAIFAAVLIAFLTDIIVQCLKKVIYDKNPTTTLTSNMLVLLVSLVVTAAMYCICVGIGSIVFVWWHVFLVVLLGFVAAFIGMFGYDKFMQTVEQYKNMLNKVEDAANETQKTIEAVTDAVNSGKLSIDDLTKLMANKLNK